MLKLNFEFIQAVVNAILYLKVSVSPMPHWNHYGRFVIVITDFDYKKSKILNLLLI